MCLFRTNRWAAARGLVPWLLLGVVVVTLASFATRSALLGRDRTWARIAETGIWRVGMDPSFPPFENLDSATGRPVGFDVDLAEAIAGRWGVRVEFVGAGFDQLLDAVAAHRVDSALSALPVMPHRTREVRFSDPYIEAGMVLAASLESPLVITLKQPARGDPVVGVAVALAGRRLAAEWGSEGDALARVVQAQAPGGLQLVLRDSTESALGAVVAGEADAAIVDAISLALFNRAGRRLAAVGPPLRSDPYAIIVPAGAPDLLNHLNEALIALRADGVLEQIKARWLEAGTP
jgi:polar amino acid transport system substrate-binding protein